MTITGSLPAQAEPRLQQVRGTKFRLQPPQDFAPADRFSGFVETASGASIMIVEMPAPFAEIKSGLSNPDRMITRGLTILEQTPVSIQGREALLLSVQQSVGGLDYQKWILVLGHDSETVMATATFLKEHTDRLSEPLKQSILTLQWDQNQVGDATTTLNYSVQAAGDLKLALEMTGSQLYAKNGSLPSQNPEEPLFVVTHSLGSQVITNPEAYAQKRLLKTENIEAVRIQTTEAVRIDGLSGYAITATAQDSFSKTPTTLYQVMLFEPDQNYFIMQGLVGSAIADKYLPLFKQMAQSFQRQLSPISPK